jgi:hypothetical protein
MNHPIEDHSAEGATYNIALEKEAAVFQKKLLLLKALDKAEKDMIRLSRKAMANVTGIVGCV